MPWSSTTRTTPLSQRHRKDVLLMVRDVQPECLPDTSRHLVHHLVRQLTGGITAKQAEHARAAQRPIEVRAAGHDVKWTCAKPSASANSAT